MRGGGRGGRGRGRGRGGGRGPSSFDMLRDNLEDLGIDLKELPEDKPPPLYPPIQLPPPMRIEDEDAFKISKMRDLCFRWQTSPYFLIHKTHVKDIARYSDKYRTQNTGQTLEELIASDKQQQFIPDELLEGLTRNLRPRLALDSLVSQQREDGLSHLEANEKRGGEDGEGGTGANKNAAAGDDEEPMEEAVEEDLDDDYAVNYYDSGGEDSGGDYEPTF